MIVAEIAGRRGVQVDFVTYLRAGIPITLITLGIGVVWLMLV